MKELIEKLLKGKVGTSYVYENHRGFNVFSLRGYGRNVIILHDVKLADKILVQVIYPSLTRFVIDIEQNIPNFDDIFVSSVKLVIEMVKKYGRG